MVLVTAIALQKWTPLCLVSEKPQVSVSSGYHPDNSPRHVQHMRDARPVHALSWYSMLYTILILNTVGEYLTSKVKYKGRGSVS